MSNAGRLNFDGNQVPYCEQGADFSFSLHWEDSEGVVVDLTSYTAKMQIRRSYGKDLVAELSTENTRIDIDSSSTITLNLLAAETALLPAGKFLYDLEITSPDGIVTRLIEGDFVIKAEVTL